MDYEKKMEEWEKAQRIVSDALALKRSFQDNDSEKLEFPKDYLTETFKFGSYITHHSENFKNFTQRKLWDTLRDILKSCNKPPTKPVVDENGSVTYWCDILQYRKPTFSVPIAKLMQLLVATNFSDECINLSYKVMRQVWFKRFTVAEEIEVAYNAHFA